MGEEKSIVFLEVFKLPLENFQFSLNLEKCVRFLRMWNYFTSKRVDAIQGGYTQILWKQIKSIISPITVIKELYVQKSSEKINLSSIHTYH